MENTPIIQGPASIEGYSDNLQQKLHFCSIMLKSSMVPSSYKTPEAILIAVLFGKELGFSPIRSLYSISVIQGTPTINAQAMKALAISKGAKIKALEWTSEKCTLCFERGDWKEEVSYSMQDADAAGLSNKDNWKKNRKAMLYARAVSIGCRNQWADVLGGMYSTEELKDAISEDDATEQALDKASTEEELNKIVPSKVIEAEPDWYSFKYVYALPHRIPGKNMTQLREWLQTKGFKRNPKDDFWYGNLLVEKLIDYLKNGQNVSIKTFNQDSPPENIVFTDADLGLGNV